MPTVRYTADAARSLRKHGNMAGRIRKAVIEVAEGTGAHANNVTPLVGSTGFRLRVGDFRVIFERVADGIVVTRIAPRGEVYQRLERNDGRYRDRQRDLGPGRV